MDQQNPNQSSGWQEKLPKNLGTRRMLASAVILGGAALLAALIFLTGPSSDAKQAVEKAWPVSTLRVNIGPAAPSFRAFGKVQSRSVAKLSTDISASVSAVSVSEGDFVKEGQLLVALDDGEYRLRLAERAADLAEQRANLASMESELKHVQLTQSQHANMNRIAQAKLKRHEELMRDRLISQSLLDEVVRSSSEVTIDYQRQQQQLVELPHRVAAAKALVAKAQALHGRAQLDLEKTQILAPFSGPVLSVTAAIGDRMLPGTVVATLADVDAFELRVPIPDNYVPRLRKVQGQTPDNVQGLTDDGQPVQFMRLASTVASGQSGVDAFFAFNDIELGLPATGQVIELQITLPMVDNVFAVPPQAIYENKRIYRITEARRLDPVQIKRVGEIRSASGEYQILIDARDLQNGQQVVTTQLPKAMRGLLVQPTEATIERLSDNKPDDTGPTLPKFENKVEPAVLTDDRSKLETKAESTGHLNPKLV